MNHCLLENFSRIIRIKVTWSYLPKKKKKVTWSCLIYFQLCFFLKLLQNLSSILKKNYRQSIKCQASIFFRIHLYGQSARTNPIIYLRWPVTNRIQFKINDHILPKKSHWQTSDPHLHWNRNLPCIVGLHSELPPFE